MTTAASGLVALLDRPSSGAAVDAGLGAAASQPATQPSATTARSTRVVAAQPPAVSSTLPAAGTGAPATTQTTVAATTAAPAAAGACTGQTIDGPTINTRWGPVQVEAVVSSTGQICDVDAIQSPDSHRRSQQINNRALPILHTQVMQAQSVNINGVSGATITSIGYARSLQAILDQVG
jgi:uncharacterized protein with FMN-binding domain